MKVELLSEFAGWLVDKATDSNKEVIADFLEDFLVVEMKKLEGIQSEPIAIPTEPKKRSGNGHVSTMTRRLSEIEKEDITKWFIRHNGEIRDNACAEYKKTLPEDIAIFQITGYVSYLHNCVASGKIKLDNIEAYIKCIKSHRTRWATFNSPKYAALRAKLSSSK